MLLSRKPIEKLSGAKIMVTTQSHTSVALLEILFTFHLGVKAVFEPGNASEALAREEYPTAMLTIGDEALRLRNHELYPYRLDLGEAWHAWTGLPFVFATWVIQRKAVERWNGRLEAAISSLFAAKRWGCANIDRICREASDLGPLDYQQLQEYYKGLGFNLRENEQKGLALFYRYLKEIGAIHEVPPLELYSPLRFVA
jgi:chorismate dehydratase